MKVVTLEEALVDILPDEEYMLVVYITADRTSPGTYWPKPREFRQLVSSTFETVADNYCHNGFWLDPNTKIAPGAILSVRRINKLGYTIDQHGRRV